MKQILQNLRTGETLLADGPIPAREKDHVLIQTLSSVISLGTEKMLINFGKANLLNKAKQQPEKVKQVIAKIKTDGIAATYKAVKSKLDQSIPLGYANCGIVIDCCSSSGFQKGDLAVSNGHHAEFISVPSNLCAKVPSGVHEEEAAFTIIGAIALQGVRLMKPTLGETIVVMGLGLIGQLAVQILRANGCRVIAMDFETSKCDLAKSFGAEIINLSNDVDPVFEVDKLSRGIGVDGVLITASTKSSEPIHQAATMCRKRGRIVLVGVTGLDISRSDFYEKELSFQVSCSYGPGRYDTNYENKGLDYPIGFVRWTEKRNFEAFLNLLLDKKIDVQPLISHRFEIKEALNGYEIVGDSRALGIVINYPSSQIVSDQPKIKTIKESNNQEYNRKAKPSIIIGVIGAGSFTRQVLLPNLKSSDVVLKTIVSSQGTSAQDLGNKFGFHSITTNADDVFGDEDINTVIISTRHDSHAEYVINGISQKKSILVEKPLCINLDQLNAIIETYNNNIEHRPFIMVGFNRRFSPHILKVKQLLQNQNSPKALVMTVNAGIIPQDHWTQDPDVGGGRIIGEACHFIDLLRFIVGHKIIFVSHQIMDDGKENSMGDTVTITLKFEDGSIGTVHYFANGNRKLSKERLEIFCGGSTLQLDNFRSLKGYGFKSFSSMKIRAQDKGHNAEISSLISALQFSKKSPTPFDEIVEVTKSSFGFYNNDNIKSIGDK